MSGLRLAALYGFLPHLLGFCGPQNGEEVLQNYFKKNKASLRDLRKTLEGFEGAFPYYKLIAEANGIKDPFEERVVRAYWVGNELLENVLVGNLRKMVAEYFSKPGLLPLETALRKSQAIKDGALPHHSFHVLVIGSVTGRVKLKGKLLDLCRIGWGKVKKISENQKKIIVEYRPLVRKRRLSLSGKLKEKKINLDKDLVPKLKIGDLVSFHWEQATEVLNLEDVKNLEKYTKITLNNI